LSAVRDSSDQDVEALIHFFLWTFLAGVAVIGYEAYVWAKFGSWDTITVGYALYYINVEPPTVSWVGVQQAIDWWLSSALSWNLIIASIIIPIVVVFVFEKTIWR
jgi:hypothetical protein